MASCSPASSHWMFVVNHVFLPPKLPQEDDTSGRYQEHLVDHALTALRAFGSSYDGASSEKQAIDTAAGALSTLLCVHNFFCKEGDATVNGEEIQKALNNLVKKASSPPIIIYVAAQNAGILLYRCDNSIVVEMFELSAQNNAVMGAQGRLLRKFPGVAFQIPTAKLEPTVIRTLARTLERMSGQVVPDAFPTSSKDGRDHDEIRDTASPMMITELLAAFLLPFGKAAEVVGITKHTRDDVLWADCKVPWRRSPLWLLIKVSVQLLFLRSGLEAPDATELYKHFVVSFGVRILSLATSRLKADPACTEWCDLVYCMKAKISRRLLKLKKPLRQALQDAMADDVLQRTWEDIRKSEAKASHIDIDSLRALNFEKDVNAELAGLSTFIRNIPKRSGDTMQGEFNPVCCLPEFNSIDDWSSLNDTGAGQWGIIAAWCDQWVSNLDTWLEPKLEESTLDATTWCSSLWRDMLAYDSMTKEHCDQNPEALSLMVLGTMELWVASDKLACKKCPLLLEYDPDIDSRRLQSLLIPYRSQMERLWAVEQYIEERRKNSTHKHLWTSFGHADAFAVRYFDQSTTHKALRQRIETAAREARANKTTQYNELQQQYFTLMEKFRTTACTLTTEMRNGQPYPVHQPSQCDRCIDKAYAEGMEIDIHEWPLPSAEGDLKTVVFELDVPQWLTAWRGATHLVRFTLLGCSYAAERGPDPGYPLQKDYHLSKYFVLDGARRSFGLVSWVKPNVKSHYRGKYISSLSSVQEILFANASQFQYYDHINECMTTELSPAAGIEELTTSMTYKLQPRSSAVQKFIYRSPTNPNGHHHNAVLSWQHECPGHLSLTEYKALCTIPQGLHIQWQNILLEVTAPRVDFKKEETVQVVLQCMYQAGPQGLTRTRLGHYIPSMTDAFGPKMLRGLHEATGRIEENWCCINELACYIAIARRLLSFSPSDALTWDILKYLSRARDVGLSWVSALKKRADTAADGEKCRFRARVAHAALVCADTFNFQDAFSEGADILGLALQFGPDIADFISCCITIQECYAPSSDGLDPILHWRWQQLCFRAHPILHRAIIEQSSDALDTAITRSWVAFKPAGAGWAASPVSGCRHGDATWVTRESMSSGSGKNSMVYYCLVTGELRVNGLPLNRPPPEYEAHPMYKALFGSSVLEVMPGNLPLMVFSAKKPYTGHTVHFGLQSTRLMGKTLLVRAVKDGEEWELIDPRLLNGFPDRFVSGFVHWYHFASKTVEFRSREDPWTTSVENWRLVFGENKEWKLTKGKDRVLVVPTALNTQSRSAEHMETIFAPLVEATDLELVYRPLSSLLEIELPGLKLAFYLEKSSSILHSRQFRGMSVDPDQDIGTLIGLKNKIVLKKDSNDKSRKVLLLEGPITHSLENSHARVHVAKRSVGLVHAYDVDTRLGRLQDNGSLESKLLLCHLHALTSFCLPDPMTGRTGTEQALDILDSAAVKSFDVLSDKHTVMLEEIAALTPKRLHYPRHLRVMQQIWWKPGLGFLAQHNGFFRAVDTLFEAAADRAFLYKDRYVMPYGFSSNTSPGLVRRDGIRTAGFRVSQYGAEEHTSKEDCKYSNRDTGQCSLKSRTAFFMADYIVNNRRDLPSGMSSDMRHYVWNYIRNVAEESVLGAAHPLKLWGGEATPEYDAHWLLDSHDEILGKNLILYHEFLSGRMKGMLKPDVAIWLSTLAFSKKADLPIIQFLAACVNTPDMASIAPPPGINSFEPYRGHIFQAELVRSDLNTVSTLRPFEHCPEYRESKGKGYEEQEKARGRYYTLRSRAVDSLVERVTQKWPSAKPSLSDHPRRAEWETYIKTGEAATAVWKRTVPWFHNRQLEEYLSRLVSLLPGSKGVSVDGLDAVKLSASTTLSEDGPRCGFISRDDIFLIRPPDFNQLVPAAAQPAFPDHQPAPERERSGQSALLDSLINQLDSIARFSFEKDYVENLQQSVKALATRKCESVDFPHNTVRTTEAYLDACEGRSTLIYKTINDAFKEHMSSLFAAKFPHQDFEPTCFSSHWPRISPTFLLQSLTRNRRGALSTQWKRCIVEYGVALARQQRAERMVAAARRGDVAALKSELLNPGHQNWNPMQHPDSLLLEVESGITIRWVQEEIAARMRSPPGGRNAVMQLNMGEGKSSVIVPIVASALADGERLVRVFVAKPQSKQMLEMLTSKLGGLLNRVVFQMPISRDLQATLAQAWAMQKMMETCRDVGGVLLLQPEHALSLQQMGTEFATDPDKQDAARVLNLNRHFIHRTARDIVDESDENFSVKFELVYTMGVQQPVDNSPQRWQTIQEVLDLVRDIAPEVQREFPDAIEVYESSSPGMFPRTRILKPAAMHRVRDKLVQRICDAGMAGFPIPRQSPAVRDAVRTYITKTDLSGDEIERVEGKSGFWTESVRPTLALLRGLVACNVLSFAFMQKRWRVNYGLTSDRRPPTLLAVPYRAKDQPSARSEFSHPDVVIILTCLSYYYGGLNDSDLFLAFDQLLGSDQAEIEYGRWVRGNEQIPAKFKTLAGVNTEDTEQCAREVFPHLRLSKAVIDYFLDHIVYPKAMKEFPSKLSSSGWDLGEQKVHPTTGFSGTNDSRRLLPLGMEQLDLDVQNHINALVMSYLLQPETSVIDIPPRSSTQVSDADALLDLIVGLQPPVRVVLDVGAQVLELDNLGVACQWLARVTDDNTHAAVFFDDNDELSVVDRGGHVERLQTSPFASHMDACLVFLDEAHTRGTDLRLPTDYRAAVTLGANQTKDGLMQGCMRMRKLGHGQSVVFCVPREVKTKIRELLPEGRADDDIQVSDILLWSIRETWNSLHRGVQLWATQGRRHEKHHSLWNESTAGERALNAEQATKFLEDEAQTILERYRPEAPGKDMASTQKALPSAAHDPISARLRDFGVSRCDAATLHEEQERELAPEIETERQTELPPPAPHHLHNVHPDVTSFAKTGSMIPNSNAFIRAFKSLSSTRVGRKFGAGEISSAIAPGLYVTADFARTVKLQGAAQDDYLRSVQWLLVGPQGVSEPVMLILSPFEANMLIPSIKKAGKTMLYLYSPRVNPAYASLDDLSLYPFPSGKGERIPKGLRVALNIFAGQLYFNDYAMYLAACKFLGLSSGKAREGEVLDADGFVLRNAAGRVGRGSGFKESPVKFVRDLLLMRRDQQAIGGTHVGDMLDNRVLSEDSFN